MKFLTILCRNLFGWKTSDLIEHMIETHRWGYHRWMCVAIQSYFFHTWLKSSTHTNKIRDRIENCGTLAIYLARRLPRVEGFRVWPDRLDERAFWIAYIEELRAKGE